MAKKKKKKATSDLIKNKQCNIKNKEMKSKKNNASETAEINKQMGNPKVKENVINKEKIIAREINLDDDFDVNNKRKVKRLGKMIETFNLFETVKEQVDQVDNVKVAPSLNNIGDKGHYLYWENAENNIIDIKEVDDAVSYDTNQRQKFILLTVCISIIAIILIVITFYYSSLHTNNKKDNIAYVDEVNESVRKK